MYDGTSYSSIVYPGPQAFPGLLPSDSDAFPNGHPPARTDARKGWTSAAMSISLFLLRPREEILVQSPRATRP